MGVVLKMSLMSVELIIPVKNPGGTFISVLRSWRSQVVPDGVSFSCCIVDDGTLDSALVSQVVRAVGWSDGVRLIRNEVSLGRAGAVNAGAKSSNADKLIILDADCRAASDSTLQEILQAGSGFDGLVFGGIRSEGYGFWSEYFNEVMRQREAQFESGVLHAFSSQYCMVPNALFYQSGGFDDSYKRYGFEDRDWILRVLSCRSGARYAKSSIVWHDDELSLTSICEKMFLAGTDASYIFRNSHPDQYAGSSYARVDANTVSPISSVVLKCVSPFWRLWARLAAGVIGLPCPFCVTSKLVKVCSGLAYYAGTAKRRCASRPADDA